MSANESQEKVDVRELEIGMYVIMPVSWKSHPFLINHFRISSPSEIAKMREAGLKEVVVDFERSRCARKPRGDQPQKPHDADAPAKEEKSVVPDSLREALDDKTLPPEEKSKAVYTRSSDMIKDLLVRPTAKNIAETKQAIGGVVDMILSDQETSQYLNRITTHDFYTYTHSVNVGFFAICLARTLFQASDNHDMHELGAGFFLHDLGKVSIPPEIINKPGRLSDEEMTEVRKHPSAGFKILREARQLTEESKTIVLQHHERVDGLGYPKKLRGNDIHIYGRICSIADVYDALTSDRPYRKRMTPFEALQLMKDEMINHFQKELFEKFVLMLL